jgi:hypothetical protein
VSDLATLKSELDNAVNAYALAKHADEAIDETVAFVTGWVVVAEVMSQQLEDSDEWALIVSRPETQRPPMTVGLLSCAIDDVKP